MRKIGAQITLQATRIVADLTLGVNQLRIQLRIRVSDNISKAIVAPSTTFAIRIEPRTGSATPDRETLFHFETASPRLVHPNPALIPSRLIVSSHLYPLYFRFLLWFPPCITTSGKRGPDGSPAKHSF